MNLYLITTHAHLPGVGLSKPGHWGGFRYPDDASAAEAARIDANGKPYDIRRKTAVRRVRRA